MPAFRFTQTVLAGAIVPNVMTGSQFEFLGRPTRIQIYMIQDGGVGDGIGESEVFFGQELELSQAPITNAAGAGEGPRVPDDQVVDDIGAPGDRIVIRLQETGGANPAQVRGLVNLTPL